MDAQLSVVTFEEQRGLFRTSTVDFDVALPRLEFQLFWREVRLHSIVKPRPRGA